MLPARHAWVLGLALSLAPSLGAQGAEEPPERPAERDPVIAEKLERLGEAWSDRKQERDDEAGDLLAALSARAERPLHEDDEKELLRAFRDVLMRGRLRDPDRIEPYRLAAGGLATFGSEGQTWLRRIYQARRFPRQPDWEPARTALIDALGDEPDADTLEFLLERLRREDELGVLQSAGATLARRLEDSGEFRKRIVDAMSNRLSDWEFQLAHPPVSGDAVYLTGVNSAYAKLEKLRHVWLAAMTRLTGGVECADGAEWATWYRENKRREWPPLKTR